VRTAATLAQVCSLSVMPSRERRAASSRSGPPGTCTGLPPGGGFEFFTYAVNSSTCARN